MSRTSLCLTWLGCAALAVPWTAGEAPHAQRPAQRRVAGSEAARLSVITGRPTDVSVTVSVVSPVDADARVEYGTAPGRYTVTTDARAARANEPLEFELRPLQPETRYYFRVGARRPGGAAFAAEPEASVQTQRRPGTAFTFTVQGDSHPERDGRMFDAALYRRTLQQVKKDRPDFHVLMGDDFSVDPLISRGELTQQNVDRLYLLQRAFLGSLDGQVPLFLVNGNHEEATRALLKGTADSAPLFSGRARNRFFPLPAPDGFYSGDPETVEGIGLLRDYYAWTWGDALFVVIDPYWHSPVPVDASTLGGEGGAAGARGGGGGGGRAGRRGAAGGRQGSAAGGRQRDWWGMTIGDAQYRWLKKTLEDSPARFKFVFAHHVLGTGRGGIEMSDLYEWGGKDPNGVSRFAEKRPGWELPIHQLMVKTGVTVFFQGHDHLFARQERDGVIYQEVPNPADPTYTAFNREAYRSGDILPNSGHLRVSVSPEQVRVEYVRAWLSDAEAPAGANGAVAFSYALKPQPRPKAGGR